MKYLKTTVAQKPHIWLLEHGEPRKKEMLPYRRMAHRRSSGATVIDISHGQTPSRRCPQKSQREEAWKGSREGGGVEEGGEIETEKEEEEEGEQKEEKGDQKKEEDDQEEEGP